MVDFRKGNGYFILFAESIFETVTLSVLEYAIQSNSEQCIVAPDTHIVIRKI